MKVAKVLAFFSPGQGSLMASEYFLYRELQRRGYEVEIYSSDIPAGRYLVKHRLSEGRCNGIKVVRCFTLMNLGGDMPITPSIVEKLGKTDADLIHVHEYYNLSSVAGWLVAKKKSIPLVLAQERYYDPHRPVYRPFFVLAESTICKKVVEDCAAVNAYSTAAKDYILRKWSLKKSVWITPMCTDVKELFKPRRSDFRQDLGVRDDELLILSVARMHRSKGLHYLIAAFKKLRREVGETKLVLVGRGPEEAAIRKTVSYFGLEDRVVVYTEPIPYAEMWRVYNSCDIYVQPSLWETFGLSVVEAMGCAKPVVVASEGGVRDIVIECSHGLRTPPRDVEQLYACLKLLAQNPQLRAEMGKKARERALSFDYREVAEVYDKLYRSIAEQ